MVTVSHHTRACPRDISALLISAFPGSHRVVTVTSRSGFSVPAAPGATTGPGRAGGGPGGHMAMRPPFGAGLLWGKTKLCTATSGLTRPFQAPPCSNTTKCHPESPCKGPGGLSVPPPATFSNPSPSPSPTGSVFSWIGSPQEQSQLSTSPISACSAMLISHTNY